MKLVIFLVLMVLGEECQCGTKKLVKRDVKVSDLPDLSGIPSAQQTMKSIGISNWPSDQDLEQISRNMRDGIRRHNEREALLQRLPETLQLMQQQILQLQQNVQQLQQQVQPKQQNL